MKPTQQDPMRPNPIIILPLPKGEGRGEGVSNPMKKSFASHAKPRTIASLLAATLLAACGGDGTTGGGTIQLSASGEALALSGYPFPPSAGDEVAFVDGWEVTFERLLVTLDHATLSENPDRSPTDQSQTEAKVAQLDGPWAVDLHRAGALPGKGGGDERAAAVTTIAGQTLRGGAAFDPTRRYAFGFDVVPAADAATKVNLDAAALADYAEMVQKKWTVLYVGTARFKGTACTSTDAKYDFTRWPTTVRFRLGFAAPASYVNCQNPDNAPAEPFDGEEHQRGVQIKSNTTTVAQMTFHTDHPFWEDVEHDAPAHFDQLAARAKSDGQGGFVVTLEDLAGVDFTRITDRDGREVPWRSCTKDYAPPTASPVLGFESRGIPYDPKGDPSRAMRDLKDYLTYNTSTAGHLNADGLCFVKRNYPSPP